LPLPATASHASFGPLVAQQRIPPAFLRNPCKSGLIPAGIAAAMEALSLELSTCRPPTESLLRVSRVDRCNDSDRLASRQLPEPGRHLCCSDSRRDRDASLHPNLRESRRTGKSRSSMPAKHLIPSQGQKFLFPRFMAPVLRSHLLTRFSIPSRCGITFQLERSCSHTASIAAASLLCHTSRLRSVRSASRCTNKRKRSSLELRGKQSVASQPMRHVVEQRACESSDIWHPVGRFNWIRRSTIECSSLDPREASAHPRPITRQHRSAACIPCTQQQRVLTAGSSDPTA